VRFHRETSKIRGRAAWIAVLLLCFCGPALAQDEPATEGVNSGNYNVKQSAEFGYRITDFTGNRDIYNTFVNLNQGPRLLDYTLELRSLNHQGVLFDRFYFSNFGYGGDPNDVSHLRAYKNKWYNFSATFRRDHNFWDYNLLANPLNPTTPVTNAPAGFTSLVSVSPHRYDTVRRMGDYSLTLRPQDKVRFRLGYSRNISEGPSFSSMHEGTDALLFQDWKVTVNAFQFGVDIKLLPRTNISYDQFFRYYKGDTGYADRNLTFQLPSGTGVDLGLPFNTTASQPCAAPFQAAPPSSVNPTCNGFLGYTRNARIRTSYPTEQLSIQSNYFQKLDLSGRLIYTGTDMSVLDFTEVLSGRVSRSNVRNSTQTGPASARRVSTTVDAAATYHVTDKFRVSDTFRFSNFMIPSFWGFTFCNFYGASMATPATVFTPTAPLPATCTNPVGSIAGASAPHSTSSGADLYAGVTGGFLKQDLKNNLFELEYDFTSRFGGRLGYRFRHRTIDVSRTDSATAVFYPTLPNTRTMLAPFATVTCPAANNRADGSCLISQGPFTDGEPTEINENSGLLGIWARPTDAWRIRFDVELMSADNSFTRISPRQMQQYRLRSTYKPRNWINVGAAINILEARDNVAQINNLQHNRSVGGNVTLDPNGRFTFDVGYDYNNIYSQINICFVSTPSPPGVSVCPNQTVLQEQLSTYVNKTHFGYFNVMWRPWHRLGTHAGYTISSTTGSALLINPNAPPGTLDYNYHKPYAGIDFNIAKGLTWKTDWGYYGYNEKESAVPIDLLAPRDFRGNMVTLAMRYAF
jgi:hypothetical protein